MTKPLSSRMVRQFLFGARAICSAGEPLARDPHFYAYAFHDPQQRPLG
jgi:hypothetical protein